MESSGFKDMSRMARDAQAQLAKIVPKKPAAPAPPTQQDFLNQLQPQNAAFANQLAQQALGQQMSPAMQQALQQNQAAQIGLARSMKGGNQALAQRNLAQNAQQAQQQTMLGGTAQAQGMFGNYLGQQQGYNAQLLGIQAGIDASKRQADAQAQASQNQMYGSIIGAGASILPFFLANGGQVSAPGTHYANYFSTMKNGGQVPGYNQGGTTDSLKNDTVPTMLSPGEIVIPKSVVNGPNPKANAAKFVEAILAKQGMRK